MEDNAEFEVALDSEDWRPEGYTQPKEDEVFVDNEHLDPLTGDQLGGGTNG